MCVPGAKSEDLCSVHDALVRKARWPDILAAEPRWAVSLPFMLEQKHSFDGFRLLPGHLDLPAQRELVAGLRDLVAAAPLYEPVMPKTGKPLSVRMTNAGALGWISDRAGYRYSPHHPVTARPWPDIPQVLLQIWHDLTGWPEPPECCLVNFYADAGARMGMHRDADEKERRAPVLSVSLGDTAVFRMGGPRRKDATRSVRLASGDVLVMEGPARDAYHGVDRILPGSSTLLRDGGRINLTLRRVTVPAG